MEISRQNFSIQLMKRIFKNVGIVFLVFLILIALLGTLGPSEDSKSSLESISCNSELIKQIEEKKKSSIEKTSALGGLTNKNYLVFFKNGTSSVVKIFNFVLNDPAQKREEVKNQMQAWNFQLAPKIELINENVGIIDYIEPLYPLEMQEETLKKCASLIGRLHCSGMQFHSHFDFLQIMNHYISIYRQTPQFSEEDLSFFIEVTDRWRGLTNYLSKLRKVPCHNDLHLSNFVMGKEGMKLVDWEDSAMNDPAWDVARFFITSFVPEDLWDLFLNTYSPHFPETDPSFLARIKIYRPFIFAQAALFLKLCETNQLNPTEAAFENDLHVNKVIDLCMMHAKLIFANEKYQALLSKTMHSGGIK